MNSGCYNLSLLIIYVQQITNPMKSSNFADRLNFILIYPLLWGLSKLPFAILYFLSDCAYLLVFHLFKYRRRVVRQNLATAFPELSEERRSEIERKFYHHFCDIFVEMVKTISISQKEMTKRFTFENIEIIKKMEAEGKSIILMCSHYASYEWLVIIDSYVKFKAYGVYKKLKNKYFDDLVKKSRGKFGGTLIPSKEVKDEVKMNAENHILSYYGFVSDQSPRIRTVNYFTKFFGVTVPAYTGAEYLAKKFDMNVIFLKTRKIKRGFYTTTFEVLDQPITSYPDYAVTDRFLSILEGQIKEAPEYYLWTHKRFKHRQN